MDDVFLIVTKSISWGTYVAQFFLPTLLGNVIGRLSLVAALGHAQVVGGKGTIEESRSDTKRKLR
jgi:formate-nitrite transporter family protein